MLNSVNTPSFVSNFISPLSFDDIVTQRQTQSCSLTRGFSGAEWQKDFISYFLRDAIAVVLDAYFYFAIHLLCADCNRWFISFGKLFLLFIHCIKGVVV